MKTPWIIAGKKIFIETDVVDYEIPLLLSKDAMKKAGMSIKFATDTVTIFGRKQDLLFTSLGHYSIPLENHIRNNLGTKGMPWKKEITVTTIEGWNNKLATGKRKATLKLHWRFSHASYQKIENLLQDAAINDT